MMVAAMYTFNGCLFEETRIKSVSLYFMLGTTIYRRHRLRRLIVIALLAFVAYTLLLRPVKTIREVNVYWLRDYGYE